MPSVITTYGDLKASVLENINRQGMAGYVSGFVQQAERKLLRVGARTPDMIERMADQGSNTITAGGILDLPSDFIEVRFLYIDGSPIQQMDQVSMEQLLKKYPSRSAGGKPVLYAIGHTAAATRGLHFGPFPDSQYDVEGEIYTYTALHNGADTATTGYLQEAPDALLYGSLLAAVQMLEPQEYAGQIAMWQQMYDFAITSLADFRQHEERSGSQMRVRRG